TSTRRSCGWSSCGPPTCRSRWPPTPTSPTPSASGSTVACAPPARRGTRRSRGSAGASGRRWSLAEQRVGTAFDAHRLVAGRRLVLGGVVVPSPGGLDGHSDADIVCHALCDAVLGATSLGDIGRLFPNTEEWRDAASLDLLARVCTLAAGEGWGLVNAD